MPLAQGSRLGPYEIIAPLGAGGMGEVYRALDTRLDRTVALKILPDTLAADPQFRDRFDREARTISQLSHPNICPLFDVGHQDGVHFLVMEYLDGETLADRLSKSQLSRLNSQQGSSLKAQLSGLPVDQALRIAIEIAAALDAAHRQGVVHRDLKPGNVMLTKAGAKLLDFGLAKTGSAVPGRAGGLGGVVPDLTAPPTMTTPLTAAGTLLGTFQYMAPEQLEGGESDARSDIFAFGAVLYEMVAGKKAFTGKSQVGVMAAILEHDPPALTAVAADAPPALARLVQTCLAKDPDARWQTARDLGRELEWIAESMSKPAASGAIASMTGSPEGLAPQSRKRARGLQPSVLVLTGLVVSAISAAVMWAVMHWWPGPKAQLMRFAIVLPQTQPLARTLNERLIALSPDGSHLVYLAGFGESAGVPGGPTQLMVRGIDQLGAVPIRGLTNPRSPFISPDGKWVGFVDGTDLKKVSMNGGPPIAICKVNGPARGASWGPDDTIVFATGEPTTGILQVPMGGGEPRILTTPDVRIGEIDHLFPSVIAGGRAVLFTILVASTAGENLQVAVLDRKTGRHKVVIRGGSHAEYVETGHLVYAASGVLRVVRFDLEKLEVIGDPVPLVDQLMTVGSAGVAQFAVSRTGVLAYVPGGVSGGLGDLRTLVWVDRRGREEAIAAPPRSYVSPRLSPDGAKIALDIRGREQDVWVFDLARQMLTRLTTEPGIDGFPVWTPDGRRIIFESNRTGIFNLFWQPADGTGAAEALTRSKNPMWPLAISPDGTRVVLHESAPNNDIDVLVLDGKSSPEPLVHTTFDEMSAAISPDGHWLAYESNESGQPQVYVRPFPSVNAGHWQISPSGGQKPVWARNGKELFYLAGRALNAVPIQTTPTFNAGIPVKLFEGSYYAGLPPVQGYDVSPDGQKFLMIKDAPQPAGEQAIAPSIVVVLNWIEELKARVGK